ncbi:hypothetical protein AX17_006671 [Amanita inopinata Kibby_2008]|nr:hypothetical protein AX17_006671 [Amanita inopinata Kibby_2008]
MCMAKSSEYLSFTYKSLQDGTPVYLSLYPPTSVGSCSTLDNVPAIIYFHGGGLTVGDRNSWHPTWLQRRANAQGFAFIIPDYRLVPPATGHSILSDIEDLFAFFTETRSYTVLVSTPHIGYPQEIRFHINPNAIAVAGSSAGGLCAYLAAVHCNNPKPKAILSMYGMGGNFFTPHYLSPKKEVFFRGRELLDPTNFFDYLYPSANNLKEIADSPLAYNPPEHEMPGYPANPRMLLARLYLQLGVFLDYYTGCHSPSLSASLRKIISGSNSQSNIRNNPNFRVANCVGIIPEPHRCLFPQLHVTTNWPPTILCHGTADTAVLVEESRSLHRALDGAGVSVASFEFEGEEHSFDYEAKAEEMYGETFDKIMDTLKRWILE